VGTPAGMLNSSAVVTVDCRTHIDITEDGDSEVSVVVALR